MDVMTTAGSQSGEELPGAAAALAARRLALAFACGVGVDWALVLACGSGWIVGSVGKRPRASGTAVVHSHSWFVAMVCSEPICAVPSASWIEAWKIRPAALGALPVFLAMIRISLSPALIA